MHTRNNTTTVWACTDCLMVEANGECDPDRPADLPEPLCLVDTPYRVSMGMLEEEHGDYCQRDADGECDCETRDFSTSACELCGDWLAGTRHAFTWWHDDE